MPQISIIVPVYNVEPYLGQCIDSILAQTFTDFELFLVDDGSTDGSGLICDEYAKRDSRVLVIHKKNGGQSEARNVAIDIAGGEYITFIDSDDLVSSQYLMQMLTAARENDADITVCDLQHFNDGETVTWKSKAVYHYNIMKGRDVCVSYYQMTWIVTIGPLGKLFKTDLFRNVRFPVGKIYEDQGTIPRLFYLADKAVLIPDGLFYAYRFRKGSTTHSAFSPRKFEDVWNVELCREFFLSQGDGELTKLSTRFRDILQAKYIVQAYQNNAADQIPDQYKMNLGQALRLLRRETSDDVYTWYLSLIYPQRVRLHSYIRKVREMLKLGHIN